MASSIIHLAITNELIKRLSFIDANRLKFGAVVVDAGVGGNKYGNAHMKITVQDGTKKTYDFDRYREMFGERMLKDDLYLGYYLHLVQDALYRNFVYDRYHWNPVLPGNVERLHKDYEIINQYVINKYDFLDEITEIRTCCGFRENMIQVANKPFDVSRLELACLLISWMFHPRYHGLVNDLIVPDRFEDEALNQISAFDTKGLMQDMSSYFLPMDEEPIFFFTKEMSDEFIEETVEFCTEEVKKIRNGERGIDMLTYAWNRAGV